ncbi:hypothetical protein GBA52_001044, partial [Prunus armeniaca]
LHFVRHVSISYTLTKKQSKKGLIGSKQNTTSIPRSISLEEIEAIDKEEEQSDRDIEQHDEPSLRRFTLSAKIPQTLNIPAPENKQKPERKQQSRHGQHDHGLLQRIPISSLPRLPFRSPESQSKSPSPKSQPSQKLSKSQILSLSSSLSVIAATSLSWAPPSLAEEIEKAALFDFDLTLPIQMVQFLLLMVALDKLYYSPLRKFMDERDAAIREKLGSVKDTSEEVKQLEQQGIAIMRAARAEISAALTKMKKETQGRWSRNWRREEEGGG